MSAIAGTHIVVGITGGIAAYKSVELTRRLRDQGADVRVVVTPAGQAFITPLTLQAPSGQSSTRFPARCQRRSWDGAYRISTVGGPNYCRTGKR